MASKPPKFKEFVKIEQDLLTARLDAIRAAIDHAGEKGRAMEEAARRLIRSFLPAEYGLSSGFVAYQDDEGTIRLSKQLDVIIFDAVRAAPLMSLDTCDVFPLEAVYAYVEVKAALSTSNNLDEPSGSSLEKCLKDNHELRTMRDRSYWMPIGTSPSTLGVERRNIYAIRSYIFAFEGKGYFSSLEKLAQRVSDACATFDAHMHGVFAADLGFVYTKPVDVRTAAKDDYYHTAATKEDALLVFKTYMLQALATFPRPPATWVPELEKYYGLLPKWIDFHPTAFDAF
jgi:hypothetical protein